MFLKDKIESIVDDLKLDLKGKVVLTEAATILKTLGMEP